MVTPGSGTADSDTGLALGIRGTCSLLDELHAALYAKA
jgi:hypothetical protein